MNNIIDDLIRTIDDEPKEEIVKPSKSSPATTNIPINESYGMTPLEDKVGRDLWVRTRMCYCPNDAETDCRFHSSEEKGWEQCPLTETASKNRKILGRWLWARNPRYGQAPTEEEMVQLQKVEVEPTVASITQ